MIYMRTAWKRSITTCGPMNTSLGIGIDLCVIHVGGASQHGDGGSGVRRGGARQKERNTAKGARMHLISQELEAQLATPIHVSALFFVLFPPIRPPARPPCAVRPSGCQHGLCPAGMENADMDSIEGTNYRSVNAKRFPLGSAFFGTY